MLRGRGGSQVLGFMVLGFKVPWFLSFLAFGLLIVGCLISWLPGFKVYWFLGCWFLGFLVSWCQSFLVAWLLGFKDSKF